MSPVPIPPSRGTSRELLSEGVRRQLQVAILDGTLVAGERLHDEQLIGWLGVSRTPIRTALDRLSEAGLVEMRPNRFTRVALPTAATIGQTLEVYGALAAFAVEGRVDDLDDDDRAELRALIEPVRAFVHARAGLPWRRHELEVADRLLGFFHRRSGNPQLDELVAEVRVRLVFGVLSLAAEIDGAVVTASCDEILLAVEQRDEPALVRALSERLGPSVVVGSGPQASGRQSRAGPGSRVDSGGDGAGG